MEIFSVPRTVLEADEKVQIALRAALECVNISICEYEACMRLVWEAIDVEESLIDSFEDQTIVTAVESDIQWKKQLFSSLPIGVTEEQLRAVIALVKSRPFLRED